ncbi:MAG: glycosyltransferase family 4 protein [Bacteroides sp.]|nr:glycosyltransferase family 4 protein [Bacteroides sp.]
MLTVTLVCSSLIRLGPTNVIYNMLNAYYSKKGDFNFKIVTISPEEGDSRIQEFLDLGINVECANIQPGIKGILHAKKLKTLILSTNPDIVHSYGFRADMMVSLMDLGDIPKVSSLWNNPFDDYTMLFGKIKGYLMAVAHLRQLRKFNNVVVCSEFIKEKVEEPKLNLSVIYTGVPSNYFVPLNLEEKNERRKQLNIPPDTKVYLFIGNLINRKNPKFLIESFKRLNDENKLLIIMGDGPLMGECIELVGDNKNIRLIGAQPGTLYYLQIADFYISASLSEGFPTAVLEAMGVDVIPILSDIAPHREMIKVLPANLIFKNNDFESISDVIIKNENINIPVREIFLDNYSADTMQKKYIDLYKMHCNRQ